MRVIAFSEEATILLELLLPYGNSAVPRSLWTEGRDPGLSPQRARGTNPPHQLRLNHADRADLLQRRPPDLLLRGEAQAMDPFVVEVQEIAGLVESDRERVRQQV